jgi:CYTH domain-containing protein
MELEKRFRVDKDKIPFDECTTKITIEQIYAITNDEIDVRIRKAEQNDNIKYTHTTKYKTNNDNMRVEIESEMDEENYNKIFSLINKKPLVKYRYLIPYGDFTIELDEFIDVNKFVAEVEFNTESEMNSFKKPSWFGEEVKNSLFSSTVFSYINSNNIYEKIKLSNSLN